MAATIAGFAPGEPISRLLKAALGGLPGGGLLLLPFCYGCATLLILKSIPLEESPIPGSDRSVWGEIQGGLRLIGQLPSVRVRGTLAHLVLLYSLLATLYVLTISLAFAVPGLRPTRFGTLLAMSGVGMAAGALAVAQLGCLFRCRVLASTGLGAMAWSLVLLAQLRGNLPATLALCVLLGAGASLLAIPAQTIIQEDTPEAMRGKAFDLQNNLINMALSLPLVLAGGTWGGTGWSPFSGCSLP